MTGIDLPLTCQLGDCRNRAALTVTIELPTDWSGSREYRVVTLLVAVCGECAPELEACGRGLLEGRVGYAGQQAKVDDLVRLMTLLVSLIEAVGPPFEPVQGSVYAGWLARLDKPTAQGAWRLLAEVKRKATAGHTTRDCGGISQVRRNCHLDQSNAAELRVTPPEPAEPYRGSRPGGGGGDDAA
jgi:hypothetical protein